MDGPINLANVEDGNWRRFIVDWNATTTTLDVFLVNAVTPIVSYTSDIVTSIFGNDSLVFGGLRVYRKPHNIQKFCTVTDLESPVITSCQVDVVMDNSPEIALKLYLPSN